MTILSATADWWHNLSRTVKIVGYVGVTSGAIVSAAQAWPLVEPYWYAHRGYVRSYDGSQVVPLLKRIIEVQLVQDRERRQQLLDEVAKRSLELQSDLAKQAPEYKALVQERVNRISEELKTLDEQDNSLFNEKKAINK
jgi:hypothetical protein